MKKSVCILLFFVIIGGLYAQTKTPTWDNAYFSLDGGFGSSDVLVEGMSFALFFEPKFIISPRFTVGIKNGIHFSTDDIIALETQGFFRWNFLRLALGGQGLANNSSNIFIQGGIGLLGAFRRFEDEFDGKFDVRNSRASVLADVTAGITIPLSSNWHIEPSIRGGYPFNYGAALTIGRKFPLPQRTIHEIIREYEYVEIIRTLPPNEIISRMLISQVEYIIFAPNIAVFNQGLDHDAQSLNDLVLDHTAQILRENTDYRIRIEGHANPVTRLPGESEELAVLSESRAHEVARLLRQRGIAEEQIIVIAHGGTRVVAGADDHDHWNMNRRVELIIVQVNAN